MEPHRAAAWRALADGEPLSAAAMAAAGAVDRRGDDGELRPYSSGTVAKWKREWEETYGLDLFRSARRDAAAERTELARTEAEAAWWKLRKTEALNAGVTGSQLRTRILEILPSVATVRVDRGPDGKGEPVVVAGPHARQVRDLAMAYAELIKVAEVLEADAPAEVPAANPVEDLFGALRQSSSEDQTVLTAAQLVIRQLRPDRAVHLIEASEAS